MAHKATKCCHEALTRLGCDPGKCDEEIQGVLEDPICDPVFTLCEKAKADPSCAAQCQAEGDERLLLALGVFRGVCDHVALEVAPSPRLQKVIKGLAAIEADLKGA